ncbi:hypothetical protein PR202_gb05558 [Eleusine coracana subsp. coracana]|uniref:Uncharacterized protein n=1 Tax=Eleusine coracana subsp. coracana TaxID=191504 RepID=A0AAV5E5M9_ELECO|nr:hypothetical protein PR202_gb05558 [Eleusine coracana subsp. coracana]
MTFYAPSTEDDCGSMHFMLVDRDKVLATDQTGRAAFYDAGLRARPRHTQAPAQEHSFEALVYERGQGRPGDGVLWYDDWRCHPLPTPPYLPADIDAYAVVGGSELLVSPGNEQGTYSFDTARRVWAKQGDWALPFQGLAEYVPEYKRWFGLSNKKGNLLLRGGPRSS